MLRYEFFKLDLAGLLVRYYLMMATVIIGGFSGQWWIALFALPIFISAISGLSISFKLSKPTAKENTGKIIRFLPSKHKQVS